MDPDCIADFKIAAQSPRGEAFARDRDNLQHRTLYQAHADVIAIWWALHRTRIEQGDHCRAYYLSEASPSQIQIVGLLEAKPPLLGIRTQPKYGDWGDGNPNPVVSWESLQSVVDRINYSILTSMKASLYHWYRALTGGYKLEMTGWTYSPLFLTELPLKYHAFTEGFAQEAVAYLKEQYLDDRNLMPPDSNRFLPEHPFNLIEDGFDVAITMSAAAILLGYAQVAPSSFAPRAALMASKISLAHTNGMLDILFRRIGNDSHRGLTQGEGSAKTLNKEMLKLFGYGQQIGCPAGIPPSPACRKYLEDTCGVSVPHTVIPELVEMVRRVYDEYLIPAYRGLSPAERQEMISLAPEGNLVHLLDKIATARKDTVVSPAGNLIGILRNA